MKPKLFELNKKKKKKCIKQNPIVPSKTPCSICGFLLDVQEESRHKRWYDFIVECKYLFLRNIYNGTELKCMKTEDNEKML